MIGPGVEWTKPEKLYNLEIKSFRQDIECKFGRNSQIFQICDKCSHHNISKCTIYNRTSSMLLSIDKYLQQY